MPQVKLHEVKDGDTLIADGGFTCIPPGPVVIKYDPDRPGEAGLFFYCSEGQHFLDGQVDDASNILVGLSKE